MPFRHESTFARRAIAAFLWGTCLATCALFAARAHAQQGAAVLSGTVKDVASGSPLADAVVTVTSPALQAEEIAVTDAQGT